MLTAPLKWLVQLVAWLPDLLRPGVFVTLILLIAWFVFIQRGLPNLWHASCRAAARVIDFAVGLMLLPDYFLTRSRARVGKGPGNAVLTTGEFAERILDAAAGLYERHQRIPIRWKRIPWLPGLVVVIVFALPWIVMKKAPATSTVRWDLSSAFNHWRDFERWADVPPSRRAQPGITWPPRPVARHIRRRGHMIGITIICRRTERCIGKLFLWTAGGKLIRSRLVAAPPRSSTTVHMKLSQSAARAHHFRIRIARTNPT